MKRPWQVWLVYVLCAVGLAAAMAWLTQEALHNDRLRRTAQAKAELEQRVNLALWRMDTELAPIIAEEVVRPPSDYRITLLRGDGAGQQRVPPAAAGAQQASQLPIPQSALPLATSPQSVPRFGGQQEEIQSLPQASQQGPSSNAPRPVVEPPAYVLLQFEARPNGTWHSPQVPDPEFSIESAGSVPPSPTIAGRTARLAELADAIELSQLLAELPTTSLPSLDEVGDQLLSQWSENPEERQINTNPLQFFEGNQREEVPQKASAMKSASVAGKLPQISEAADFERRSLRYQSLAGQSLFNAQQRQNAPQPGSDGGPLASLDVQRPSPAWYTERVGVTRPVWIGDRLILARRVGINGAAGVQGCWLDWPRLKTSLLDEAVDLLPGADLIPIRAATDADLNRTLAGLPVRLVVGRANGTEATSLTLRWALWMGWGALVLATAAAAALLYGVLALSERRAAFVSSVTHELRTPLTTFRMYAEMLAQGMVPDTNRRQEYLRTLQREAERLTLLVENVLAYARLERGRKPQIEHKTTVDAIFERIHLRLEHRAEQAGMKCIFRTGVEAGGIRIATDANVVEQILFNLVDNAAKYAQGADDRRIRVEAQSVPRAVELSVRDYGPGIPNRLRSRRLRAFFKTAEQSAESAPGVGLGLTLCRRLARQLGGRLEIDVPPGGGTVVSLFLPAE